MDGRVLAMDRLPRPRQCGLLPDTAIPTTPAVVPGQTLRAPGSPASSFTFTDTAARTGGELLAFDFALKPGGAVRSAVHPIQTERFEVPRRAGCASDRAAHADRGAGDVIEVEPGIAPGLRQRRRGGGPPHVEVRPALAMENMFAEVVAMAEAGRMTRRGMPRSLRELASAPRR